jgi:anhydro-N-acetylmuramic acid kinase
MWGIGIMSGSSLDGLDIAAINFQEDQDQLTFEWGPTNTVPYLIDWEQRLINAPTLTGIDLISLDVAYGKWIGQQVSEFCTKHNLIPDFVASHGHTVFHFPAEGFTFQLGNGESMVTQIKAPVITQFRQRDVTLGGQGAPLVPAGEIALLSDQAEGFLNLGGIANIHIPEKGAWDICGCNQLLNYLSQEIGLTYDKDGKIAQQGKFLEDIFIQAKSIPYLFKDPPKSLGNNQIKQELIPIFSSNNYSVEDRMFTAVNWIISEIVTAVKGFKGRLMITGGGAWNTLLIDLLRNELISKDIKIILPEERMINYKEALIFGWMGYCTLKNKININSNYTGAKYSVSAGAIHFPDINRPTLL